MPEVVPLIMQFLSLPWDDRVLQPGQHARENDYISTPSYSEVVRPISAKSVDRWRHYAGMGALQSVEAKRGESSCEPYRLSCWVFH
jgi:hypothetical protein